MQHSLVNNRGVIDKSYPVRKINFHKNSPYERVFKKCVDELFEDPSYDMYSYYLSDAKGFPICKDGFITIEDKLCSKTILVYMEVINARFASKVRINFVRKEVRFLYNTSLQVC